MQIFSSRLCGVDTQSQEAYELAAKGLIRPENTQIPVVYGIKLVYFDLPNFTIGTIYGSTSLYHFFPNFVVYGVDKP